jgi:hypothetical protein
MGGLRPPFLVLRTPMRSIGYDRERFRVGVIVLRDPDLSVYRLEPRGITPTRRYVATSPCRGG